MSQTQTHALTHKYSYYFLHLTSGKERAFNMQYDSSELQDLATIILKCHFFSLIALRNQFNAHNLLHSPSSKRERKKMQQQHLVLKEHSMAKTITGVCLESLTLAKHEISICLLEKAYVLIKLLLSIVLTNGYVFLSSVLSLVE